VAPFHVGASEEAFWEPFVAMNLPRYLFPVPDVGDGRTNPVVPMVL